MSDEKIVESTNKHAQTIIHCFPHVLTPDDNTVKVFCDRSCQTAVSAAPDTSNFDFYAALEFVPYHLITTSCVREVDLPRRAFLQWRLSSQDTSCSKTSDTDLRKGGVLKRNNSELSSITSFSKAVGHPMHVMQRTLVESEIQTMLSVVPHILDEDEVANVFTEVPIQTSITFVPNESNSTVVPKLKANLNHISNSTTVLPPRLPIVSESEVEITGLINLTQAENNLTDEDIKKPKCGLQDTVNTSPRRNNEANLEEKPLDKIANQLRVQLSTLELTPTVFPPEAQFEGRMVEVLNTTVAVFQTEMAKVLEMYHDANNTNYGKNFEHIRNTKSQTSCSCKNGKTRIPNTHSDSSIQAVEDNGEFSSTVEQAANRALQLSTKKRQEKISEDTLAATILHEIIGDIPKNTHSVFIPCECHPSAFGAAPPIVTDLPTFTIAEESDSRNNIETITDVASASSFTNNELSMITDDAPSLAEDTMNFENTTKFEIILDRNIKDIASTSATSAIVIHATLSCPNTNRTLKQTRIISKSSLPDLRDQVIRLSVIHKTAPELQIEETLTSCPRIITSPHASCTPYETILKNLNVPHVVDEGTPTCKTKVCHKESSKHCNKVNKCTSISKRTCTSGETKSKLNSQFTQNCNVHIEPYTSVNKLVSFIEHPPPHKKCLYKSCTPRNDGIVSRSENLSAPVFNAYEVTYSLPTKDDKHTKNLICQQHVTESYMEELIKVEDLSAGVQTDLTLGDKLKSESLSSLDMEVEDTQTNRNSQTEIPWEAISLMPPETYSIQPSEPKKSLLEDTVQIDVSSTPNTENKIAKCPALDFSKESDQKHTEPQSECSKYTNIKPYTEDYCSNMDIPWKDIIVPKNCKIEKEVKIKESACNKTSEKSENADKSILQIHIGIDKCPSCLLSVSREAISQQAISVCSDTLQQPKRVPKQLTFLIDIKKESNISISIEEIHATIKLPGAESKSSNLITMSGKCSNKDSDIINIKSSAVCGFLSERFILNKSSANVKVNEQFSQPCNTLQTKSCSAMQSSNISEKPSGNTITKTCTSMPDVSSNLVIKATISLKNIEQCEHVVNKEEPPDTSTTNCKLPDKPKPDAVLAAIEAYEAEMKPLMKAVNELHEKIKNLNITDTIDCGCISKRQLAREGTVNPYCQSKSYTKGEPEKLVNTTSGIPFNNIPNNTPSHYSSLTCPYLLNSQSNNMASFMPPYTYQTHMPMVCMCATSSLPGPRSGYICRESKRPNDDLKINENFPTESKTCKPPRKCNRINQGEEQKLCTPIGQSFSEAMYKNSSTSVPSYTYQTNMPSSTSLLPDTQNYFCHDNQILTNTYKANKGVQVETESSNHTEELNGKYKEGRQSPLGPSLTDTMHKSNSTSMPSHSQQTPMPKTSTCTNVPLPDQYNRDDSQSLTKINKEIKDVQIGTEIYKGSENDSRKYKDEKQKPCFPCSLPSADGVSENTSYLLPSYHTQDISTSMPTYTYETQTPGAFVSAAIPGSQLGSYHYDNQAVFQNDKVNKSVQVETEIYRTTKNNNRKYQKLCFPCNPSLIDNNTPASFPSYTYQAPISSASAYTTSPILKPNLEFYSNNNQILTNNYNANQDLQIETEGYITTNGNREYQDEQQSCYSFCPYSSNANYKTTSTLTPTHTYEMPIPPGKSGYMAPSFPNCHSDFFSTGNQISAKDSRFLKKNIQMEIETYKTPKNYIYKYEDDQQNSYYPYDPFVYGTTYNNISASMQDCEYYNYMPVAPTYMSLPSHDPQLGYYYNSNQVSTKDAMVNKNTQVQTEMYKTMKNYNRRNQNERHKPCGSSEKCRNVTISRSSENTTFIYPEANKTLVAQTQHKPHRHRHTQKYYDGKRVIHTCKPKSVMGLENTNNQNRDLPWRNSFEKYLRTDQAVRTSPEEFLCFPNSHRCRRNSNKENAPSKSNLEFGFLYR